MPPQINAMASDDYDQVLALWQSTQGIGLSGADSRENIGAFLERNPGLSLVVRDGGNLIGAVLCGHDGRRGFLHHLAVAPPFRGQGLGRRLVTAALHGFARQGIQKCHLFVLADNPAGLEFWRKLGWEQRTNLQMMSKETS